MRWSTPLAPLAAVLALLAAVHLVAADTCYGPVKSATKSETGKSYTEYTIDPWIVPSLNTTDGSLPAGACGFASYPDLTATCKDSITFIGRPIAKGLRVHGVYLLENDFVNQTTGEYHCPSTATDVDLRNTTNPGRCRGDGITQVAIDPTLTLTAPFESSQDCSGYVKLDGLEVLQIDTSACSTPTVITSECTDKDVFTIKLSDVVKKGTTKTVVFSCPNISGNQPGTAVSHCNAKMVLRVKVTC